MEMSFDTVKKILDKVLGECNYDYCSDYGEPGYSHSFAAETPVIVLGNYNEVKRKLPRIWAQMESQGVQFEWQDEWVIDYEADKAYRTEADSYSWQPSLIFTEDGDMITPESDIEDIVEWAKDNPRVCIPRTIANGRALETIGFKKYNVDRYESGWHPGQTDNPETITEEIRKEHGDSVEIVFALDSTGQFDIAFSAYTREVNDNDN